MSVSAWRITKRKHGKSAFSGEGARDFGGRWNNPGSLVVYAAQSQSLAALEMLVHLESPELLGKYVLIEVEMEDGLISRVDRTGLPKGWRNDPPPAQVRAIGDEWVLNAKSAVLQVPSVLVPGEDNFLINPLHADFPKLKIGKPVSFQFDARLLNEP